jgi:hypothetical protein
MQRERRVTENKKFEVLVIESIKNFFFSPIACKSFELVITLSSRNDSSGYVM